MSHPLLRRVTFDRLREKKNDEKEPVRAVL